MKITLAVFTAALALAVLPPRLRAHHSFVAEFDIKKPITVKGTITKFEWTNPHSWLYVDGKDENGKQTNWAFEGTAPSLLTRRGVAKTTFKVGDVITIEGFRAK